MLQEQETAVVDPRETSAETAGETQSRMLALHRLGHHLPLDAERRVGQQIIETLALVLVVVETVAETDIGSLLTLDEHVGTASGVSLGVQLLAEHSQTSLRVELAKMILGNRQHPAGSTRRIKQRLDHTRPRQQLVVVDEQQIHHQPDHLTRREMLTSRLIRQLRELADQLLVEITHFQIRNGLGTQVKISKLRHNQVQQVVLVKPIDLHVEVELVDNVTRRLGEPGDVVAQVSSHVVGITQQRAERMPRRVDERLPSHLLQDRLTVLQCRRQLRHRLKNLILGRLQHAIQPPQHCQRQNHPAILRRLVHTPQ